MLIRKCPKVYLCTSTRHVGLLLHASSSTNISTNNTVDPIHVNKPTEHINKAEFEAIKENLYVRKLEDWYEIPASHINHFAQYLGLPHKFNSTEEFVQREITDHNWEHAKFAKHKAGYVKKSAQNRLKRMIAHIFPDTEIKEDYRKLGIIGAKALPLEIDIYLPALQLGFEYHERHHYLDSAFGTYTLQEYQQRDQLKRTKALELGITIISVPFWWDWEIDRLISTIKHFKPDITLHPRFASMSGKIFEEGIPKEIADKFIFEIPNLGPIMTAMILPQTQSFNPVNWWVSEKYDGMRAVWDCTTQTFFSRWGHVVPLPLYMVDCMDRRASLDGEIWFGRHKNARYDAIQLSHQNVYAGNKKFTNMVYMVFDITNREYRNLPYSLRYNFLKLTFPTSHLIARLTEQHVVQSKAEIEEMYYKIKVKGGEGVIVRDPTSPYVSGASHSMYKHKGFMDAEALVLEKRGPNLYICQINKQQIHQNSQLGGKTKEEDGFWEIEIPTADSFHGHPGQIEPGVFVTFKYSHGYGNFGPPINSQILYIRNEVTSWEQVVRAPREKEVRAIWKPRKKQSWTHEEARRGFLCKFAEEKQFDPQIPDNWYHVSPSDIDLAGGGGLLGHYGDSYTKMVMDIFPNIGLDELKFTHIPRRHYEVEENCKKVFDRYAKENNFDPLVAENWEGHHFWDKFSKTKGAWAIKNKYSSLQHALRAVYPTLDVLDIKHRGYLKETDERRRFLENFAKERKFDPLSAENWYSVKKSDIIQLKGGFGLLWQHGRSHIRAITELFPEVTFDRQSFRKAKLD